MSLEEYKDVYVFAQQVDGEISGISYELLGKAKDLAAALNQKVVAVLMGYNVKGLADSLAEYGADKVRKGAGEKVVPESCEDAVDYIVGKMKEKHIVL